MDNRVGYGFGNGQVGVAQIHWHGANIDMGDLPSRQPLLADQRFAQQAADGVRAVFELLEREQGIPRQKLARVHAPIGLAINAQTPQEIAVSIMAEVIGVMRGEARGGGRGAKSRDDVA